MSGVKIAEGAWLLMDQWQSEGLKTFPELQEQINQAQGGIHGLWVTLSPRWIVAYRATPVNEDFIRRVYE